MDILEILKDMTAINSPSGCEDGIREYIKKAAEKYCDEVYTDNMGSLIAHKRGKGKKIMFAAHMDEIGIIVKDIDEKGFIYFSQIGGLNKRNLVNLRVRFLNGTEGVIGADEEKYKDNPAFEKLYIDIGAADKADALKYVGIGDTAAFTGDFYTRDDVVISKAIDNRAGCAVLVDAVSKVDMGDNDVYFVFTTQEEVGLRGARTAAFSIEPEIAIAVDTTDTGDVPYAPKMAVTMGGGAAIKVMDYSIICDVHIREGLKKLAQDNNIPYQLEIMTDGGTDAGSIHLSRGGIRTGGISIPTRYIHSVSEMASISDIKNCSALLKAAAEFNWQ